MYIINLVYLICVLLIHSQRLQSQALQIQDSDNTSYFKSLPCPNAEDIAPCTCKYVQDGGSMDLDCNSITDEQELHNVFHAAIPFPKFRKLQLGTNHLETLSDVVFGNSTFEEVYTEGNIITKLGTLKSVGPKTFIKSASTLKVIHLNNNKLTENTFPFDTLPQYNKLTSFSLRHNPMSSFPIIKSKTMEELWMGKSEIHTLPAGALDNLPNLEHFWATVIDIDSMALGLFRTISTLEAIHMNESGLMHLEALQFECNSSSLELIDLQENEIANIDADAFKGVVSGTINLIDNQLTLLPDATWRSLIEAGVTLKLKGNDLLCGCDVAWLVLKPSFHELVEDARCHDGDLLVDLDPIFFEQFC